MARDIVGEITLIKKMVEDCKKKAEDAEINGIKRVTCGQVIIRWSMSKDFEDSSHFPAYDTTVPGVSNAVQTAFEIVKKFYRKKEREGTSNVEACQLHRLDLSLAYGQDLPYFVLYRLYDTRAHDFVFGLPLYPIEDDVNEAKQRTIELGNLQWVTGGENPGPMGEMIGVPSTQKFKIYTGLTGSKTFIPCHNVFKNFYKKNEKEAWKVIRSLDYSWPRRMTAIEIKIELKND